MILRYEREVKTLKHVLADKPNEDSPAIFIVPKMGKEGGVMNRTSEITKGLLGGGVSPSPRIRVRWPCGGLGRAALQGLSSAFFVL